MNEDCTLIACPVPKNPVQDFSNQYTLDGLTVGNQQVAVVINNVTVIIPANTINVPVPQFPGSSITVQGCNGPITLPVPFGATAAQIQQISQELANQAALAQAQCSSPPPFTASFTNQLVTFNSTCTDSSPLVITSPLPAGMTQVGNTVTLKAGMFSSSISQADANNQAQIFLNNFMANLFLSGGASCNAGCNDTEVLTNTTADFNAGGGTYDITVANSAVFFANGTTVYNLIQANWDFTAMSFVVNAIIDPFTINITEGLAGGGVIPFVNNPVKSGAKIYQAAVSTYITNPPGIASVTIQNFSSSVLPFLSGTCVDANCNNFGSPWNGSFPNFDPAFGGGAFAYEEGSGFGFTDHNVLALGVFAFWIRSIYGGSMWQLVLQCNAGADNIFIAFKFGGRDATGVYYWQPGTCLYPAFTNVRCCTVVAS